MNKKRIVIGVLMAGIVAMMAFLPVINAMPNNDMANNGQTPEVSGVFASSGLCVVTFCDIFHQKVLTTNFEANWTYSPDNGSLIHEYSIYWESAKTWWDLISWVHIDSPAWANPSSNCYVAYGNGQYHVGVWYISITEDFHSQEKVLPNSYGCGQGSSGNGNSKYS